MQINLQYDRAWRKYRKAPHRPGRLVCKVINKKNRETEVPDFTGHNQPGHDIAIAIARRLLQWGFGVELTHSLVNRSYKIMDIDGYPIEHEILITDTGLVQYCDQSSDNAWITTEIDKFPLDAVTERLGWNILQQHMIDSDESGVSDIRHSMTALADELPMNVDYNNERTVITLGSTHHKKRTLSRDAVRAITKKVARMVRLLCRGDQA